MRRIFSVAIVSILTVGLLLPLAGAPVRAEDLSPSQVKLVQTNCVAIKNSLNQLHVSDTLLRVNRGQVYEAMATRLMDAFNDRLASNRLDNMAMITVTSRYRTELAHFRTDYITYEKKLSEAIRIDCVEQPNTFHAAVQEARTLRKKVHDDVLKLHRLIDDYRTSVSGFLLNYERLSE